MKLNLLPTEVSKAGAAKAMWFVAGLIALAGVLASVGLSVVSAGNLATAKADAESKMAAAVNAAATAAQAETQMQAASVIIRNQALAEAMDAHNSKYVDLYRDVFRYVPSYFRLTSIQAQPVAEGQTAVTLTGQLETFRQYADLAVAMWKVPDVLNVTRQGYTVVDPVVPSLTETDQAGTAVRPGEAPLPSDPLERLDAMIARAASEPRGFQNVGGFGTADTIQPRGPLPNWSTVTISLVLGRDLRTPDPRATIGGAAGGGAAVPGGGFGAPPMGFGGRPAGPPPGFGPGGGIGRGEGGR